MKPSDIHSMIRVNHAGEYGAKRIYDGQLAVLRGTSSYDIVKEMKDQELEHLETFEDYITARRVRPTALMPLWHAGGWMLGAVTAAMGERSAMACTVAVESVIAEHYAEQEATLPDDEAALKTHIAKFRADEIEHHDTGLKYNAEKTPAYSLLYHTVRGITKTAIALSKKI
jgi:3-demethoxyubiquinol 3-hydroxylase